MNTLLLLGLALFLFVLGLFHCLTEKRFLGFLLGVELMLNAAALNFAAFYLIQNQRFDFLISLIFVISFAVIESVAGLAIFTWAARSGKNQPEFSIL